MTATLFFLGVLPYQETINQHNHLELARKWLGEERSAEIEERFVTVARSIGYRYEVQVRKNGVSVLLAVMVAAAKKDLAEVTKAAFATTRRWTTVTVYHGVLRRFGDWLGAFDPAVTSVAAVRRSHIEAFRRAVATMRVGEYATPTNLGHVGGRLGQPFAPAFRQRCLSCVKTFFEVIDTLEYSERPGRQLFLRGDIGRLDDELPRFIPDDHGHRFVAAEGLRSELASAEHLPLPLERTRAILGVLLEAGLRAGELCRLDTGCVVAAQDAATGQVTHWLRVPVGKLHNDRMIPIRPSLVQLLDAWMRQRGPQPLL